MKSILFILAIMLAAVSTTLAQQTPTFPHPSLSDNPKSFLDLAKSFHARTHHQRKVQPLASVSAVKQRLDSMVDVSKQGKMDFIYDANGNLTQANAYSKLPNNQLVLGFKAEYNYDNNGLMNQAFSYWADSSYQLKPFGKFDYIYENNLLQRQITSVWIDSTSSWRLWNKDEYTYDTNQNLTNKYFYWYKPDSLSWKITSNSQYLYDSLGRVKKHQNYVWDSSNWYASSKAEYVYDSLGNLTEQTYYESYMNEWRNFRKSTYAHNYDYTQSDVIVPYYFNSWSYHMITSDAYYESAGLDTWELRQESNYYYSPQEITSIRESKNTAATVYPNPAKEFFTVALSEQATVSLYDAQGRKVLEETLQPNAQVSLKDLPTGLYYYQICTTNGQKQGGKLVKE